MTSPSKVEQVNPTQFPDELIRNLLSTWELQFEETPMYQKTDKQIHEFVNSMRKHIETFEHQSQFFENCLQNKVVFKLLILLVCRWNEISDESSDEHMVASYFINKVLDSDIAIDIVGFHWDNDMLIRNSVKNLYKMATPAQIELLANYFGMVSRSSKGRKLLISSGFVYAVHLVNETRNCEPWKTYSSKFKNIVLYMKNENDFEVHFGEHLEKNLVQKNSENQAILSRHEKSCFLMSPLELLLMTPDCANEIRRNSQPTDAFTKIIMTLFKIVSANETKAVRMSVIFEFLIGETYKDLPIGISFGGGVSAKVFHGIVDKFSGLAAFFNISLSRKGTETGEDHMEHISGTRVHLPKLSMNSDGYCLGYEIVEFSKYLFISFSDTMDMRCRDLNIERKEGGLLRYHLYAMNRQTEDEASKHSSFLFKTEGSWKYCNNGLITNEDFKQESDLEKEKVITFVKWTVWQVDNDTI